MPTRRRPSWLGRTAPRGTSRRSLSAWLGLLAVCLGAGGCITRSVYDSVFEQQGTEVRLREHKRLTSTVPRGFDHPFTISAVRLAHILSRIDIRSEAEEGLQRYPAIPLENLYTIADGMAAAFAAAGPDQELVVQSLRRTRRWGLFNRDYLTSLVAYRKDGLLYVHLARCDWEVPPSRNTKLPQPQVGEHPLDFRVVSGHSMSLVDSQSVAVAWRDDIFDKPTRTRVDDSGKVVRRTILMESPPEEGDGAAAAGAGGDPQEPAPLPGDLSADQLRALADLEDRRRRGEVTETDYMAERRRILEAAPAAP